jgi:hypothetical protein
MATSIPRTLRASSLNIATHCPGAPALLATATLPKDVSATLEAGTLAHRWLHAYTEKGLEAAEAVIEDDRLAMELLSFWAWWQETGIPAALAEARCEVPLILPLGGLVVTGHADLVALHDRVPMVIDWKYGRGQRHILPLLEDDLQLPCYGLLHARATGATRVRLLRVLVSDRELQGRELGADALRDVEVEIERIARAVLADPDRRTPGPHCEQCLARHGCSEYQAQIETVTAALVPGPAPTSLTPDQAVRWALARKAVAERVDTLDAALHRYLEAGGEVEVDGQALILSRYQVDTVADHRAAVARLREIVGDRANLALAVSKTGIVDALKTAGLGTGERERFLQTLREAGIIGRQERASLKWKRVVSCQNRRAA